MDHCYCHYYFFFLTTYYVCTTGYSLDGLVYLVCNFVILSYDLSPRIWTAQNPPVVRLPVHKTRSFLLSPSLSSLLLASQKGRGKINYLLSLFFLPPPLPSHSSYFAFPWFFWSSRDSLPLLACRLTPPRVGCSIAAPLRRYIIHPIRNILRGYWIGLPEGKEISQEAKTNEKKERLKGGIGKSKRKKTQEVYCIFGQRKIHQYIRTTYYIYILHTTKPSHATLA